MLEGYPRTLTLKDGAAITLRPTTRDDEYDLSRFFASLPEEATRYLRNDVTDRKVIARWMRELDYGKVLPILAEHGGKIVASATLHRETFGWGRHVGEVRVVIDPAFQGRGLGRFLIAEMCRIGAGGGLRKLVARVVSARSGVTTAFERSGFHRVATLEKHVKDHRQQYADIVILVKELVPGMSAGA
jgi:L-amino acid N-acyltransferase YncA